DPVEFGRWVRAQRAALEQPQAQVLPAEAVVNLSVADEDDSQAAPLCFRAASPGQSHGYGGVVPNLRWLDSGTGRSVELVVSLKQPFTSSPEGRLREKKVSISPVPRNYSIGNRLAPEEMPMARVLLSPLLQQIRRLVEDQRLREASDQELLRLFQTGRDE